MTAYCETPDCFEASLNQHSDTLEGLRHRAYRDRSRDDRVGIMICDKDRLFVEGIAALIEQWDEFDLLAKIYSYDEALAAAKEHLPAVVLLGARAGDAPCAPVIRDILASDPGVCIMVLASSGDSREVLDALRAGAMGYGRAQRVIGRPASRHYLGNGLRRGGVRRIHSHPSARGIALF